MNNRPFGYIGALTAVALLATACGSPSSASSPPSASPTAVANSASMTTTLSYIKSGLPNLHGSSIAYLAECATENTYCQTRWRAAQDAAKKMNAKVTLFDAGFNPATQLQQVQDAIQQGFSGYVFSPVASSSGCADFKLLQKTGKPIENINSPMCGNPDYTKGTVGFVGMQTQSFFLAHIENAFASCKTKCEAVAVGGFVGSDLFTRWENAIKVASLKYPNVDVVSNQPGNFDPTKAFTVVQDALSSHPGVNLVVSSWDDMTRGVEKAIVAAGKVPGRGVRIYSVGGTANGLAQVKAGNWTETTILLPYEESYYGFVQLARAMHTGKGTPGFTYLAQSPKITNGPGSIFITAKNAASFTPEY